MAIRKFSDIGQSMGDSGCEWYAYVTKTALPTSGLAGVIVDFNQSSGVPKYNAFSGSALTATPLTGSGNNGIYTGPNVPGRVKHLVRWQAVGHAGGSGTLVPPSYIWLNDYLMFYPLIDGDDDALQTLVNTSTLPRYTSGAGVRIVLISQTPITSTAAVTISYTNSDGVAGRTVTTNVYPAASIGICMTTSGDTGLVNTATPYLPLAAGDSGVRSIESAQFTTTSGGFIAAVLVKPLATLPLIEDTVSCEITFGFDRQRNPIIEEGAYLNMMMQRSNTGTHPLRSELIFTNI